MQPSPKESFGPASGRTGTALSKINQAMKKDKFEEMTARIISQLEKGVVPWRRTWNQIVMGASRNHFTGYTYRGINRFMLDGFEVPRFATFHQISGAGHQVKKGAKSLPIYFWKMLFFDANGKRVETKKEAEKVVPFVSEYRVFNVLDIEGFPGLMNVKPSFPATRTKSPRANLPTRPCSTNCSCPTSPNLKAR
jgi:antirestriction protein ArdC